MYFNDNNEYIQGKEEEEEVSSSSQVSAESSETYTYNDDDECGEGREGHRHSLCGVNLKDYWCDRNYHVDASHRYRDLSVAIIDDNTKLNCRPYILKSFAAFLHHQHKRYEVFLTFDFILYVYIYIYIN